MEVLGVIAGLPGLIEIIKKTAEIASQLKHWKSLTGKINILLQELEGLEQTLKDIQDRGTCPSISPSQVARFQGSLEQTRNDLTNLNKLLNDCNKSTNKGGMRFMRQVKLLLTGFDKAAKKHIERIRDTRAELILAFVSQVRQDSSQCRSKADLLLQLERTLCPASIDFIPRKLDSTCDWIWSDERLNNWVFDPQDGRSHHQRLFCLYGPKGCGKSVLSASIADALQANDKISTFFSFWAGSESQRKLTGFLKTTLWQLIKHLSAEEIAQVSSVLMGTSPYDERLLREALDFAIQTIKSAVYLIIDGIDEAENDWNDPADHSLTTIVDLLKAQTNVHILLCGRETSLSRAIASSSSSLKIIQDFLRNDIDTLIEWHLNNSSKSHIALSKDLVRDSLQSKSEMMFLWVNLVFKELNRSPSASVMKAILSNTPPTLDEEYNRMFESLMKRLSGSSTRPSITMKTVKRIFSLILAAPEPLTLVELGCAYAAETTILSAHDYELLTREGLVDLCGDFIDESNGHFHFAHASIEEFLTRPIDHWSPKDSNVLYFRVDRLESQSLLLESCFNYIKSMEMGYPLHDKSMQSLPQNYPFFQYASRFIPFLLANAMPIITGSILKDFIASKQLCGLVEYIVHTLEMDSWDLCLHYLDLLYSWSDFEMLVSDLMAAVKVELGRREKELGEQDPRYQTWASIGSILYSFIGSNDPKYAQEEAPITHILPPTTQPGPNASALPVQFAPPSHAAALAQFRPEISALLQFKLLKSLRSVRIEFLPTWVLILWALQIWNERDEAIPRARPMIDTALRRVRKRRNFTESVCLLYLGILADHKDQPQHEIEQCRIFCWFREALEIAQALPSSPQVEAVIHRALDGITWGLLLHEHREKALSYSRQLEHRVCNNEVVQDDSGWLKRVFYRGSVWTKWKVLVLGIHTKTLDDFRIDEDAARLSRFVLDLHTERNWDNNPSILKLRWSMSRILWDLNKVEDCRVSLQILLEHLQRLKSTQYRAKYWWKAVSLLASCLVKQSKEEEARQWLLQIPFAIISPDAEQAQWLGFDLLELGCIDHALELYKLWGREKLSKDLQDSRWNGLIDEFAVERMLEMGIAAKDELRTAALLDASREGKASIVEFLLAQEGNIESRRHFRGCTPLSLAVEAGHVATVKLLLDQSAEYEWPASFEWTPLTLAAHQGHDLVVRLLLDHGTDKNGRDKSGVTPLTEAASKGNVSIVKLLLDYGADKNGLDSIGSTPLMQAAEFGHTPVVKLLLENGADHGCENSFGWTSLALAVYKGNVPIANLLLDYGAEKSFQDLHRWTPLTRAVRLGYYLVVKLLLDYGADKNGQDSYRWTPLTLAVRQGYDLVVKLLLDYGADVNGQDSDGWTPLTLAACQGRDFIVKLLLNYGANENGHDAWGWTPITRAACEGHSTVVDLLLDHGVDKNGRDPYGYTPIIAARRAGQVETVIVLLDYGVQGEQADSEIVELDEVGETLSTSSTDHGKEEV